jgi:hypothetical protein
MRNREGNVLYLPRGVLFGVVLQDEQAVESFLTKPLQVSKPARRVINVDKNGRIASALHQEIQNRPVLADLLHGRSGKVRHRWFM